MWFVNQCINAKNHYPLSTLKLLDKDDNLYICLFADDWNHPPQVWSHWNCWQSWWWTNIHTCRCMFVHLSISNRDTREHVCIFVCFQQCLQIHSQQHAGMFEGQQSLPQFCSQWSCWIQIHVYRQMKSSTAFYLIHDTWHIRMMATCC